MTYYVYILKCRGERLYTGITTDVMRRFGEHSGGAKGARFTHAYPPEALAAVWSCEGRSDASKLEYAIKQLRRADKLMLAENDDVLSLRFGEEFAKKFRRENIQIF